MLGTEGISRSSEPLSKLSRLPSRGRYGAALWLWPESGPVCLLGDLCWPKPCAAGDAIDPLERGVGRRFASL